MSSEFGKTLKINLFGQSHGKAIGVVIDHLPAGEAIDMEALIAFMARRRPGKNRLSSQRRETDLPVFLSGVENGKTCGSPLCAIIENTDVRSKDYQELCDKPRPGHADYTAFLKWGGHADMRGGGHFSGRLTAPLCLAGGIAKQLLARRGVFVGAHLAELAGQQDTPFPLHPDEALFEAIAARELPVIDSAAGEIMREKILAAAKQGDSTGGVIECAAIGFPAGLGGPWFGGLESRLSFALFGIPAVKGVSFGAGFAAASRRGSQNNDAFFVDENGAIHTRTNHAGGILGGISNGMPLLLNVAIKPTPSIAMTQQTVSLAAQENTTLIVKGRHDPCIAHRAVPVVEAVTALVLLDLLLEGKTP